MGFVKLGMTLTLGRFGARADAVIRVEDLFSLHHDVLKTLVISIKTVLQQLAQSYTAVRDSKKQTSTFGGAATTNISVASKTRTAK